MNLRHEEWRLFIGGDWIASKQVEEVRLPYDGTVSGRVHTADTALVHLAADAAQRSARTFRDSSGGERGDLLMRLHAILRERLDELGETVCIETGKPIREARAEAEGSLQVLLDVAAEVRAGAVDARTEKSRTTMLVREPFGVVAIITAFHDPLRLALEQIAPALAGGNTIVHLPAAQTPFSALLLAGALEKAGVPRGAYNVVYGGEVARVLAEDSVIDARIAGGSAGATAFLVEPDADLDTVVSRLVPAAFGHSGQGCFPLQEIHIHEDLAAAFLQRAGDRAARLRIAHPFEQASDLSSLASVAAAAGMSEWIDEARAQGARQVTGGQRRQATIRPTILENVPAECLRSRAKRRGPVVTVSRYTELNDAITRVSCEQVVVFTADLHLAFRAARRLRATGVGINDLPAGGWSPRRRIENVTALKAISWGHL